MLIKSQKQYHNEIEYITSTPQKLMVYELFSQNTLLTLKRKYHILELHVL